MVYGVRAFNIAVDWGVASIGLFRGGEHNLIHVQVNEGDGMEKVGAWVGGRSRGIGGKGQVRS